MNTSARLLMTWLILAALGWCAAPARGLRSDEGPPPSLHITTYASPSGEYALTVDPSRLHGGGPGTCRMEKAGVLVWERELNFTFWEAGITDDSVVAGYAYTLGVSTGSRVAKPPIFTGPNRFRPPSGSL